MTETSKVIGQLNKFTEKLMVSFSVDLTEMLFDATPELTGFAETNWLPTIGKSAATPAGSRSNVTKAQQDRGLAILRSAYKLPAIIYITNPVSYVEGLNDGSNPTSKALPGFVQTTIASAIQNAI